MATLSTSDINNARNGVSSLLTGADTSEITESTGNLNDNGKIIYEATFLALSNFAEDGSLIFDVKKTVVTLEAESYQASVAPNFFVRIQPEPPTEPQ